MAKLPRLTAAEAERRLVAAGFVLMRSKGSQRIYSVAESAWSFHSIEAKFCIRKLCARCSRRPGRFERRLGSRRGVRAS